VEGPFAEHTTRPEVVLDEAVHFLQTALARHRSLALVDGGIERVVDAVNEKVPRDH
jgi:hypothetical protein